MKITWISTILMVSLLLAAATGAMADGFSCGSRIVATGDRQADVLRKCGEPAHVASWEEVRIKRDFAPRVLETEMKGYQQPLFVKEHVAVEEWEYNLGPNRFIRYVRFENGRLITITEGDYGY